MSGLSMLCVMALVNIFIGSYMMWQVRVRCCFLLLRSVVFYHSGMLAHYYTEALMCVGNSVSSQSCLKVEGLAQIKFIQEKTMSNRNLWACLFSLYVVLGLLS